MKFWKHWPYWLRGGVVVLAIIFILILFGFVGSNFWVHQIQHSPILNDINSSTIAPQSVADIPVGWKTYQDTEWGFQISYPPQYHFVSSDDNLNGPSHYLLPQQSYAESGYVGKLLEVSTSGTSTVQELLQIVLLPTAPKSLYALDIQVQDTLASSSTAYKNKGMSLVFKHVAISGRNFPAISNTFLDNKETQIKVYYFQPPVAIFGKSQVSKLFRIDYQPENSTTLKKIVSTIKTIPIVPSDQSLYYSAESSKDPFWCDKISKSETKTACYIKLRGHPIIDKFSVNTRSVLGKRGAVQVSTSAVTLATSRVGKNDNVALVMFAVTTGTEPWQALTFEARFTDAQKAQSLLTVYWDDQEIGQGDGRVLVPKEDFGPFVFSTSTEPISLHRLAFRLDSFAPGTTSVTISNIKGENVH